jgi:hypothetical protein
MVGALAAAVIALVASAAVAAGTLGGPASGPSTSGYGQGSYASMMGRQDPGPSADMMGGQGQGTNASMMGSQGQERYAGMMGRSMIGSMGSMGIVSLPGDGVAVSSIPAARARAASAAKVRGIATSWLTTNRSGTTIKSIDAYPGYFTLDLQRNGVVSGMMSVNSSTGAVWYHTWHGAFIAMEDN